VFSVALLGPGFKYEVLWVRVESLLPVHRPGSRGPVPLSDRKCLQGILFVLYTGINWKHLPPELGFGSGITCWRRFRRWCEAGVWDQLHRMLLSELHSPGEIDWSVVCLVAPMSGPKRGRRSRPFTGRPGPARLQAPHRLRLGRHPARDPYHRGGTCPTSKPLRTWSKRYLAGGGYDSRAFRKWLHAKRIASVIPQKGPQEDHRTRPHPLGRRTGYRALASVQTPRRPLGPAPADASGLHQARRRTHLLEAIAAGSERDGSARYSDRRSRTATPPRSPMTVRTVP
jgi:hypothetical protein